MVHIPLILNTPIVWSQLCGNSLTMVSFGKGLITINYPPKKLAQPRHT